MSKRLIVWLVILIAVVIIYLKRITLFDLGVSVMKRDVGTQDMEDTKRELNLSRVSEETARLYASNAGFSGESLDTIVAIAHAESGLDPNAIKANKNSAGVITSYDRGILQINTRWHPEVTDLDAFNPVTAFAAGYTISKAGTDFSPWVTYNTGAYLKYLPGGIA